jgi:hypothetical protein
MAFFHSPVFQLPLPWIFILIMSSYSFLMYLCLRTKAASSTQGNANRTRVWGYAADVRVINPSAPARNPVASFCTTGNTARESRSRLTYLLSWFSHDIVSWLHDRSGIAGILISK